MIQCLHNMSLPPRSRILVAPGITATPTTTFYAGPSTPQVLGSYRASGRLRDLCRDLSLEVPAGEPEARDLLTQTTTDLLQRLEFPAAAVVVPAPRNSSPCEDPLLTIAVLSRASDRIFFAHRRPSFELRSLCRCLAFVTSDLPGLAAQEGLRP